MADEPDTKKLRVDSDGEEEAPWALDEEMKAQLQRAEGAQEELNKINEAASEEVLQVEQRYNVKRQPVYRQRGDALAKVPHFWRRALLGHPNLQEFLTEDDLGALAALERVDVVDAPDIKSGFTITFTFNAEANPCFSNPTLEKTLKFGDDASLEAKATTIEWKEGMAPDDGTEQPGEKRARVPDYNFFTSWFLSEKYMPGTQDAVADYIKEDVWPEPVKYFKAGMAIEVMQERGYSLEELESDEGEEGEEAEEGEEYEEGEEGAEAAFGDDGFGGVVEDEDEGEEGDDQGS